VHITVLERSEKTPLNSPGGEELMKRLGGGGVLPFYAFLDDRGGMIVNSIAPAKDGKKGGDIGHPDAPHEVDWFMEMLGKAVPAMTAAQRDTVETWLRHQKK
jgi:hypothetical protein